jgi:hypothetical protein
MTVDTTVRTGTAVLVVAVIAIGTNAQAQAQFPSRVQNPPYADFVAPPPLTPADMINYCVYENRVYSLGAGLCIGRTPYVCVPSPGPSTGNRAYWASKEDQVFLRPVCN